MKRCTIGICLDKKKYNWVSSKIEVITGDGHHVFMVVDGTLGKEKIIESHMNIGGVRVQNLSKYNNNTIVLMAEPTFLTSKDEDVIIQRAMDKVGCKYDVTNIMGKLFKTKWDKKEKFICSELIAYAWLEYYKFLGKEPKTVTPHDFVRDVVYLNTLDWNRFLLSQYNLGIVE